MFVDKTMSGNPMSDRRINSELHFSVDVAVSTANNTGRPHRLDNETSLTHRPAQPRRRRSTTSRRRISWSSSAVPRQDPGSCKRRTSQTSLTGPPQALRSAKTPRHENREPVGSGEGHLEDLAARINMQSSHFQVDQVLRANWLNSLLT